VLFLDWASEPVFVPKTPDKKPIFDSERKQGRSSGSGLELPEATAEAVKREVQS